MHSGLWIPRHLKPARKTIAVVFWHSPKINRIVVGLPEQYPIPAVLVAQGFQKVVCRSAHEVELWSQKLRDQERRDAEMTDEERERFEGPIRAQMRAELVHLRDNARNAFNRDFCQRAIDQIDAMTEAASKVNRESYMHIEAFEDGK